MTLLLGCTLAFTGCSADTVQEEEPAETKVVYQALPLPELYLEIPAHFGTTSSQFYEEYYICEDASIIITQDTAGAPYSSLEDYAVSAIVEYQNITTAFDLTNDEIVYAGNIGVKILEFTYTIGEGDTSISKSCMAGYLTDLDSMYIITCKSDVDTYETYRQDFLDVITSAAFVK